jgi:large subunit ribosomal protein L33
MAKKAGSILIKLVSLAGTGFFYTSVKNPRNVAAKLQLMKYDPVIRQHVLFRVCIACVDWLAVLPAPSLRTDIKLSLATDIGCCL